MQVNNIKNSLIVLIIYFGFCAARSSLLNKYGYSSPYVRIRHQKYHSGMNYPYNQHIILQSPPKYFNPFYFGNLDTIYECPKETKCSSPFNSQQTQKFKCSDDNQCPQNFKCCPSSCFYHKVCKPASVAWKKSNNKPVTWESNGTLNKKDKSQQCPQYKQCLFPLNSQNTRHFQCLDDTHCPRNCKCCPSSCFNHNVCRPVTSTESHTSKEVTPYLPKTKFSEKEGTCPFSNECSHPLDVKRTYIFKCTHDSQCPNSFKCCANSCFVHKVCRPATISSNTFTRKPEHTFTEPNPSITPVHKAYEPHETEHFGSDEDNVEIKTENDNNNNREPEENNGSETRREDIDNETGKEGEEENKEDDDADTEPELENDYDDNMEENIENELDTDDENQSTTTESPQTTTIRDTELEDYDETDEDYEEEYNENGDKNKEEDLSEEDELLSNRISDKSQGEESLDQLEGSGNSVEETKEMGSQKTKFKTSRGDANEEYEEYYDEDYDYIKRK